MFLNSNRAVSKSPVLKSPDLKSASLKSLGAVAAEFALGFPLLVLLIMMLVDSGLYLFQRALLTDSTARLNRAIVTQLGQREAEISFYGVSPALPVTCNDLKAIGSALATSIKNNKAILYQGMSFKLKVAESSPIPYRLITTGGEKTFECLTCKFFPVSLIIKHTSVLVIERPPYTGMACNNAPWASL